jgi:hypothetical protein
MTDALLLLFVAGTVVLALAVDRVALVGWLRDSENNGVDSGQTASLAPHPRGEAHSYRRSLLTQKMPSIGIVSGVLGASGHPALVAISSSAFVGISASGPQGRPPVLGDHKRGYRGHGRAAAQAGQTPSQLLRRTQAAERY